MQHHLGTPAPRLVERPRGIVFVEARVKGQLKGVYAATVTPWRNDDTVDEAALWRQIEMLAATGVQGICVAGTTGEFPRLTLEQHTRLLRSALEMAAGRIQVLACVGSASLRATLGLCNTSVDAAALLVPPPIYLPYPQPEVRAFLEEVARATEHPVLLYNIPQCTTGIAPETAADLLRRRIYGGIKESGGDRAMLQALAAERRQTPFVFFYGADRQLPEALRQGADGAISGVASCAPEVLIAIYRAHQTGDHRRGERAAALLGELLDQLHAFPAVVGIRIALEARGIPVGPHAVPLAPETETRARQFRRWLEEWLPRATTLQSAGAANQRPARSEAE